MKIVFFGTPEYVLPVLRALHNKFKDKAKKSPIIAVVTQNPKPAGRKKIPAYSPVDRWAHKRQIPKFYNPNEIIFQKIEADLGILAAYGEIISAKVLSRFPSGILNIHPSLLPKFRGASPVQASIISGEKETGATIIKLDSKIDHGAIVSQFKEEIKNSDTTGSLRERLFIRSAEVLAELIHPYMEGKIKPRIQDEKQATYTRRITKNDGFIPPKILTAILQEVYLREQWKISFIDNYSPPPDAELLERFIRGMQPWPVAWTKIRAKNKEFRMKILKAHISNKQLALDQVQLEGKKPVSWEQFKQGYPQTGF